MAEIDAAYSFTIPSIEDDTPLDCRIYHPKCLNDGLYNEERLKSVNCAVLAHPYAPLGGCYDDPVVLYTTETLLGHGFIVGTFNFRYVGGLSKPSTGLFLTTLEAPRTRRVALRGLGRPSKATMSPS